MISGCGWTGGTSHGNMTIGRGAGYFRRKMINDFGHSKSQVPVNMYNHYDLLKGFLLGLTYSLPPGHVSSFFIL